MNKFEALVIAALPVATFALGAWAQDHRMREHYINEGKISATYDLSFDATWLYLGCLGAVPRCEAERAAWKLMGPAIEKRRQQIPPLPI